MNVAGPEASSSRFTLLPSQYLSSRPPLSETTLPSLLAASDRLADEAREALSYSFDECTYSKGYLRQSVWSCVDCGERGVCYGCSISCHSNHQLIELWTRRHFRCDCPTTAIPERNGKRRKCTLNRPDAQPQSHNEENRYGTNFSGMFCRCGREYDVETETEAMLNCMACEDWFHESCLNLRPTLVPNNPGNPEVVEDEDDDEERQVLIPSDSYDGLICASCVQGHQILRDRAGSEGWMMIEPKGEGWEVIGRRGSSKDTGAAGSPNVKQHPLTEEPVIKADDDGVRWEDSANVGEKRVAPDESVDAPLPKRARSESRELDEKSAVRPEARSCRGKGDVFLADGVRDELKNSLPVDVVASLPFPLDDEEIYEPPKDDDQEETLDEVTYRVVGSLPRVQAIEALHGYQSMKDKLKAMLAGHAQNGKTVSKEDINEFFADLSSRKS